MRIIISIISIVFLFVTNIASALVILPDTIINSDTVYDSQSLDMTNGNFIVKAGAKLTIKNSMINGVLSNGNPNLIDVQVGKLVMIGNSVSIGTIGIVPHPDTQSLFYVMKFENGQADLEKNNFEVHQVFSVGLLITSIVVSTNNIHIIDNSFENFHGVLYLLNSKNTLIENNLFKSNSYGNMVLVGDNSKITNNKIYFAGRDRIGNAMDILDSTNVLIKDNVLFTPTCHGIYILSSRNVVVDSNSITGGITYAITVLSSATLKNSDDYVREIVSKLAPFPAQDINISNNVMSQNRYGLAADGVNNLHVTGNYFSQRFSDASSRKFWTDNAILLRDIMGLVWSNNVYKEAFSQVNGGDNSMTQFVPFPITGGVIL